MGNVSQCFEVEIDERWASEDGLLWGEKRAGKGIQRRLKYSRWSHKQTGIDHRRARFNDATKVLNMEWTEIGLEKEENIGACEKQNGNCVTCLEWKTVRSDI